MDSQSVSGIPMMQERSKIIPSKGSAELELDRQLRRAEDAIQRRAWGVTAAVVLRCGIDEEGGGEWQESLCFGKLDGKWRLHVQSGFLDDPRSIETTDLFGASLETRLLAAKKVPLLVEALQALEAGACDDVRATARELAGFIDRVLRTDC
jgi:hypothetical protein